MLEYAGRTWGLQPDVLRALLQAQANRWTTFEGSESLRKALEEFQAGEGTEAVSRRNVTRVNGSVAVLGLKGVIRPEASLFEMLFFGAGGGLNMFRSQFREAMASEDVGAIVMNIDSPGGLVDQVPEMAEEIRKARGSKPIVAVANTLAASAAYWIASSADEIVVTPSGEVGSIGVYATHQDVSGNLDKLGVKMSLISAGKFKTEGNPYEPLDSEAEAAIQQSVNDYYKLFIDAVAKGRDVKASAVRDGYGEGRVLTAQRAVKEGLADKVDTLDGTIARMQGKGGGRVGTRAEDEAPELRAEEEPAEVVATSTTEKDRWAAMLFDSFDTNKEGATP